MSAPVILINLGLPERCTSDVPASCLIIPESYGRIRKVLFGRLTEATAAGVDLATPEELNVVTLKIFCSTPGD